MTHTFPITATLADYTAANPSVALAVAAERKTNYLERVIAHLEGEDKPCALVKAREMKTYFEGILDNCRYRLVKYGIIDHTQRALFRFGVDIVGKTNKNIMDYLGVDMPRSDYRARRQYVAFRMSPNGGAVDVRNTTERFIDLKAEQSRRARQNLYMARITDEARLAHGRGWYVVFNTLTLDKEHYTRIFSRGSTAFRDFIRRITRAVGASAGLSARAADRARDELHRYFAVVEYGGKTGRLHFHILHFMAHLPPDCHDPNLYPWGTHDRAGGERRAYYGQPRYLEIAAMKEYWRYGTSSPRPVRYSVQDAFSRAGWRWPVEFKAGAWKPYPVRGTMDAVARYVAGYVHKTYQLEASSWKKNNPNLIMFRTRMTRGFGETWMREQLTDIPSKTLLWAVMEHPCRKITIPNRPAAPVWRRLRKNIIRELSLRRIFARHFLMREPPPALLSRGLLAPPPSFRAHLSRNRRCGITRIIRVDAAISKLYRLMKFPAYDAVPMAAASY